MLALYIGIAAAGYLLAGSATGAYAFNKFEEHKIGTQMRPKADSCDNCWWEGLGIIWPLFWLMMLVRGLSIVPYRATLKRLQRPKLPAAKLLQERK